MTADTLKLLRDKMENSNMTDEEKLALMKELNQLVEEMRADIAKAKITKQI